jgi:hypothetical protein
MRSAAAASAVLPASAGTALALTAGSEIEELRALEAEISQAWEHLGSVLDIFEQAEKRLAVWKEQNPKPVVRECKLYSQDEADAAIRQAQERDARDPSFRSPSFIYVPVANADYKAAWREHEEAMKAWDERHEAAKEESGYNRADALAESAHSRIKAATEAMASTRATTMKASTARLAPLRKLTNGRA